MIDENMPGVASNKLLYCHSGMDSSVTRSDRLGAGVLALLCLLGYHSAFPLEQAAC